MLTTCVNKWIPCYKHLLLQKPRVELISLGGVCLVLSETTRFSIVFWLPGYTSSKGLKELVDFPQLQNQLQDRWPLMILMHALVIPHSHMARNAGAKTVW